MQTNKQPYSNATSNMFILIVILLFVLYMATCGDNKQPETVGYFNQGQILLPDMACPDTLIVIDAIGLNKGMALIEQGFIDASDYQIDSILHTHCVIK